MILGFGGGEIRSEAYTRYVICREMGWTLDDYERQPPFFIDEIMIIMRQEAENQSHKEKESNQNLKIK